MAKFSVQLPAPANEMACEEIRKQLPFLSKAISQVRFSDDGQRVEFEASGANAEELTPQVQGLARRVQRALQHVERKVIYRTSTCENVAFAGESDSSGITVLGMGQVALQGLPLQLFRYFDRVFESFGSRWGAVPIAVPALIPTSVLARCDYFGSFPHNVTFAAHLREDAHVIDGFRSRHQAVTQLDAQALADMERPEACLSPALCYHVYHLCENRRMPDAASAYGVCGKCFRYESANTSDLRRLWDFTLREIVFAGGREEVLHARQESVEMMERFLEEHRLAGEIRTASDPFFVAPDALPKTYFQLSSEAKLEVSLMLPGGERTAVSSHNYHSDFFGHAFGITLDSGAHMHSVCVGFGLERWVYAFLRQHGSDASAWPHVVRAAPEFSQSRNERAD